MSWNAAPTAPIVAPVGEPTEVMVGSTAATTVTVAMAVLVVSKFEVAITVAVLVPPAIKRPDTGSMLPAPVAVHLTDVSLPVGTPVTVAVKSNVSPVPIVADVGKSVTRTPESSVTVADALLLPCVAVTVMVVFAGTKAGAV